MSTSSEAKQAARKFQNKVRQLSAREANLFAHGYDAATAKLREELVKPVGACAKLKECSYAYLHDRALELEQQLAHQQPSDEIIEVDEEGKVSGPIEQLPIQQPSPPSDGLAVASAPTPHVEKIAQEAVDYLWSVEGGMNRDKYLELFRKVAAQARAPLVAALETAKRGVGAPIAHQLAQDALHAINAALRGTREK